MHSNLQLTKLRRKFRVELTRLTFLSQFFDKGMPSEIQTPHFSSATSSHSDVRLRGGYDVPNKDGDGICEINDQSYSKDHTSSIRFNENNDAFGELFIINQNYILKHLTALISAEKLEQYPLGSNPAWSGSGFLTGFDVTVSLDEIRVRIATISLITLSYFISRIILLMLL